MLIVLTSENSLQVSANQRDKKKKEKKKRDLLEIARQKFLLDFPCHLEVACLELFIFRIWGPKKNENRMQG